MCTVNDASLGVVCIFGFMLKLLDGFECSALTYCIYLFIIIIIMCNVSAC